MLGSMIKNPSPFLKCALLVSDYFADFELPTADLQVFNLFDRFH